MQPSDRVTSIPMSGIRKMFDLARPGSINLGIGEPDLDPPMTAVEGMNNAAVKGLNKYGPTAGIMELRDAVASRFRKYGDITGENIMITPSGSSALYEVAMTLINPGDEILTPSPGFVIYGPHAQLAGGSFTEYKLTEGDFQPDIDDIQSKIKPNTKMIVVTTPSNPTGGVLNESSYKALCDIAEDKGITILADEVYESFIYEGKHMSFMNQLDKAIVVSGFSKMMAVTGWRMGFLCANTEIMKPLVKMQYHVCASPNMPAMYGILDALPTIDPYLENARRIYKARRDLICRRINEVPGMHIEPPKGAFYAFPSYDINMTSDELAGKLLENGLISIPGSAFGKYGENHLRFSYAADESKINAGMDILESTMKKLRC